MQLLHRPTMVMVFMVGIPMMGKQKRVMRMMMTLRGKINEAIMIEPYRFCPLEAIPSLVKLHFIWMVVCMHLSQSGEVFTVCTCVHYVIYLRQEFLLGLTHPRSLHLRSAPINDLDISM